MHPCCYAFRSAIPAIVLLALVACSPPTTNPPSLSAGMESPSLDSSELFRAPNAFGFSLPTLSKEQREVLYPSMTTWALPPSVLRSTLPEAVGPWRRTEILGGVHEAAMAAWDGGLATYEGPSGRTTVMVQDTLWEPSLLAPLVGVWRSEGVETLSDGRPIARLPLTDEGTPGLQVSAHGLDDLRLVFLFAPESSVEPEHLLGLVAGLPAPVLEKPDPDQVRLLVRSPLLEGVSLGPLLDPRRLVAGLPEAPDGYEVILQEAGFRREATRDVVSFARVRWRGLAGFATASLTDMGPKGSPVTLASSEKDGGSTDFIREHLSGGAEAGCREELGLCKGSVLTAGRLVSTVVGPGLEGRSWIEARLRKGAELAGAL